MRYLAIDLGDQRTGLAVGDSVTRLAGPVGVLEVPIATNGGGALLDAIAAAADEQLGRASEAGRRRAAGQLVVGLPLNMDGTEGGRAKLVREFAARLSKRTGRTLRFQDERLSTADADWAMARSGLTRKQKKERRDALAAAAILTDFLASLSQNPGDG